MLAIDHQHWNCQSHDRERQRVSATALSFQQEEVRSADDQTKRFASTSWLSDPPSTVRNPCIAWDVRSGTGTRSNHGPYGRAMTGWRLFHGLRTAGGRRVAVHPARAVQGQEQDVDRSTRPAPQSRRTIVPLSPPYSTPPVNIAWVSLSFAAVRCIGLWTT